MRTAIALAVVALLVFAPYQKTAAYPEGAPWGAANPDTAQSCAGCHFDSDPVESSAALDLSGLPERPVAHVRYPLEVTFHDANIVTAGFQLLAVVGDGAAGRFFAADERLEAIGAAIRSTATVTGRSDHRIVWSFTWQAPAATALPIEFLLAATAANDDGSPLGDTVHYRRYRIAHRDSHK